MVFKSSTDAEFCRGMILPLGLFNRECVKVKRY